MSDPRVPEEIPGGIETVSQFYNPSGDPIDVTIYQLPDQPPLVFRAEPGATIEGPTAWRLTFEQARLRYLGDV